MEGNAYYRFIETFELFQEHQLQDGDRCQIKNLMKRTFSYFKYRKREVIEQRREDVCLLWQLVGRCHAVKSNIVQVLLFLHGPVN